MFWSNVRVRQCAKTQGHTLYTICRLKCAGHAGDSCRVCAFATLRRAGGHYGEEGGGSLALGRLCARILRLILHWVSAAPSFLLTKWGRRGGISLAAAAAAGIWREISPRGSAWNPCTCSGPCFHPPAERLGGRDSPQRNRAGRAPIYYACGNPSRPARH